VKNLGVILLSIWLIATGLLSLLNISIPYSGVILALLAIAAGILLLIGREYTRKLPRNLGMILLSIWLIVAGLLPLLNVSIPASDVILALLAIAAGVLLLLRR
jgi:hypothetical protein